MCVEVKRLNLECNDEQLSIRVESLEVIDVEEEGEGRRCGGHAVFV